MSQLFSDSEFNFSSHADADTGIGAGGFEDEEAHASVELTGSHGFNFSLGFAPSIFSPEIDASGGFQSTGVCAIPEANTVINHHDNNQSACLVPQPSNPSPGCTPVANTVTTDNHHDNNQGVCATPQPSNPSPGCTPVANTVTVDNHHDNNQGTCPTPQGGQEPQLSVDNVTINEPDSGQTNANVTVSLDHASTQAVTFDYTTQGVTATPDQDYKAVWGTDSVTIPAGQTSANITVPVYAVADDSPGQANPNETFQIQLSNASNANIAQGVGTVTIVDANPTTPPSPCPTPTTGSEPQLSVNSVTVNEPDSGQTNANVTVSLDHAATQAVTFDYTTQGVTATPDQDYKAVWGTDSVTIPAGQTSANITVPVYAVADDSPGQANPNETFQVQISNAQNATIANGQGVVTIVDGSSSSSTTPTTTTTSTSTATASTATVCDHNHSSHQTTTQPSGSSTTPTTTTTSTASVCDHNHSSHHQTTTQPSGSSTTPATTTTSTASVCDHNHSSHHQTATQPSGSPTTSTASTATACANPLSHGEDQGTAQHLGGHGGDAGLGGLGNLLNLCEGGAAFNFTNLCKTTSGATQSTGTFCNLGNFESHGLLDTIDQKQLIHGAGQGDSDGHTNAHAFATVLGSGALSSHTLADCASLPQVHHEVHAH